MHFTRVFKMIDNIFAFQLWRIILIYKEENSHDAVFTKTFDSVTLKQDPACIVRCSRTPKPTALRFIATPKPPCQKSTYGKRHRRDYATANKA